MKQWQGESYMESYTDEEFDRYWGNDVDADYEAWLEKALNSNKTEEQK